MPSVKESTVENEQEIGFKISCDECDHNFRKKDYVDSYTEEFASCIKCGKGLCSENAVMVHVNFVHEGSLLASSYSDQSFEIAKANGIADDTTSDIFENLLHNVSFEHSGGISKLGYDHNHYKDDVVFSRYDGSPGPVELSYVLVCLLYH